MASLSSYLVPDPTQLRTSNLHRLALDFSSDRSSEISSNSFSDLTCSTALNLAKIKISLQLSDVFTTIASPTISILSTSTVSIFATNNPHQLFSTIDFSNISNASSFTTISLPPLLQLHLNLQLSSPTQSWFFLLSTSTSPPRARLRCVSPLACNYFSGGNPCKNFEDEPCPCLPRGAGTGLSAARGPLIRLHQDSGLQLPPPPTNSKFFPLHTLPLSLCFGWLPSPIFKVGGNPCKIFLGGDERTHVLSQHFCIPFLVTLHKISHQLQRTLFNIFLSLIRAPSSFLFLYATSACHLYPHTPN